MKVLIMVGILALGGCGHAAHTTLVTAHKTGVLAHDVVSRDFCRKAINECKELRDENPDDKCSGLSKCQEVRRAVVKASDSLQRAVLVGFLAIHAKDEGKVSEAVAAVLRALSLIHRGLETWGVKL